MFSSFYNIQQPIFAVLLVLRCSLQLWCWISFLTCLHQNLVNSWNHPFPSSIFCFRSPPTQVNYILVLLHLCSYLLNHFQLEMTSHAEIHKPRQQHRIKISNRRATQRCKVSAYFYAKICSLLARRRSSQPVQRVYWTENVIDWLGKWRPTCVMQHARGQKLQSFRRKWPFYMDLYSMVWLRCFIF